MVTVPSSNRSPRSLNAQQAPKVISVRSSSEYSGSYSSVGLYTIVVTYYWDVS